MNSILAARSFLFVPGDRPERFSKAKASGADVVIVDLEDAVAIDDKVVARQALSDWLRDGESAYVRINGLGSDWCDEDLAVCRMPGVAGVVLPKVTSRSDVEEVVSRLLPAVPVLPLIETADGMRNLDEIARASGVSRLMFGTVDFCLDLAIEDGDELGVHRALIVLASRAARLLAPVDGVTLDIQDLDKLEDATRRARRSGFGGKLCIHPSQVSVVNHCFMPTDADIRWASSLLEHASREKGAFMFEGRMVDAPVLDRAKRILQQPVPVRG